MLPLGNLLDIVEGFPTVDLQTGANNGDYVNLANCSGVGVLFRSGVGTAGDDPTLTFQQATNNSGGSVKDLDIITDPPQIWKKQAATSLAAVAAWTDAVDDVTGNDWTNADSAEQSLMVFCYFQTDQLDVDNDFDHIRATIADVGTNAQPGDLLYLLFGLRYKDSPDNMLSAL